MIRMCVSIDVCVHAPACVCVCLQCFLEARVVLSNVGLNFQLLLLKKTSFAT